MQETTDSRLERREGARGVSVQEQVQFSVPNAWRLRMPKLNANLSMMFNEVDFMDRFAAAAKAGFKGVEFLFPYAYDKNQLAEVVRANKLEVILFNTPPGDWNGGDRGTACDPACAGEFQEGIGKAIEYALALGCRQIHCMAGLKPRGVNEEK